MYVLVSFQYFVCGNLSYIYKIYIEITKALKLFFSFGPYTRWDPKIRKYCRCYLKAPIHLILQFSCKYVIEQIYGHANASVRLYFGIAVL